MAKDVRVVNLAFGAVLALLGTTAAVSLYLNRDRPVVREAAQPASSPKAGLPANHPPVDSAARLALLDQMSRNDPKNADYKVQMGNLLYDMGEYQKAIDAYQESLELRRGDPNVETDMATCYHYLGQDERAIELLDRVLQAHADFPQALFNKGIVLRAGKNDVKGAISVWERLLRSNPAFAQKAGLEQKIKELKAVQ